MLAPCRIGISPSMAQRETGGTYSRQSDCVKSQAKTGMGSGLVFSKTAPNLWIDLRMLLSRINNFLIQATRATMRRFPVAVAEPGKER